MQQRLLYWICKAKPLSCTNDTHGRANDSNSGKGLTLVGVTALKNYYESLGADVILLDAGDTLHGLPFVTTSKGEDMIKLMNIAGYDAMTPGNHDFNYGSSRLLELSGMAEFPMLAANVTVKENGQLFAKDHIVLTSNGKKYGIFGLASEETIYKSAPVNTETLNFVDPVETAKKEVASLKELGVDYIVCLSHLGTDSASSPNSYDIIKAAPEINIYIDGHSHSSFDPQNIIGTTVLNSGNEYYNRVGVVTIDKEGKISADFVDADKYKELAITDDSMAEELKKISESLAPALAKVVGSSTEDLEGARENVRTRQTNLGSLTADAIREHTGADIAFTNGGGIRASIKAGEITVGQVQTVFPFGNYVITKKIPGSVMLEALELSVSAYPDQLGGFLHVSGITFDFDCSMEKGSRVSNVMVGDEALNLEKEYLVASNDFVLGQGGDNYKMFIPYSTVNEFSSLEEVLIQYLAKNPGANPTDERVRPAKVLTILTTSDIHAAVFPTNYAQKVPYNNGTFSRVSSYVKAMRAVDPNLILIDTGDTLQGNMGSVFNNEPVHPVINIMNDIKYDVFVPGNHEFNFGRSFLDRNTAAFEGAVLGGNLMKEDGTSLFAPYTIIERDGVRVAIVGLTAPHIKRWDSAIADQYADFNPVAPIDRVEPILKEIEGKYDVLIGAFHIGYTSEGYDIADSAKEIAEKYPQFNIINLGHAHSTFDGTNLPINKEGEKYTGSVILTEPGSNGNFITRTLISYEKVDGRVVIKNLSSTNQTLANTSPDKALTEKYAFYDEALNGFANTIVGNVTDNFLPKRDYITGEDKITTMPYAQLFDNAVIDFINRVQMHYSGADISGAALFIANSSLNAGELTRADISNIYTYDNTLMGVNITGENLLKYMEWSANYFNTVKPGDLTLSFDANVRSYNFDMFDGVSYKIDVTKEKESRIVDAIINGQPVDPNKVYKLAVNNYRFGTLESLGLVTKADIYFDSTITYSGEAEMRQLIEKYIADELNLVVTPSNDNNWSIIGFDFENPDVVKAAELIKEGKIKIPTSVDGRTYNVEAVTIEDVKEFFTPETENGGYIGEISIPNAA